MPLVLSGAVPYAGGARRHEQRDQRRLTVGAKPAPEPQQGQFVGVFDQLARVWATIKPEQARRYAEQRAKPPH